MGLAVSELRSGRRERDEILNVENVHPPAAGGAGFTLSLGHLEQRAVAQGGNESDGETNGEEHEGRQPHPPSGVNSSGQHTH